MMVASSSIGKFPSALAASIWAPRPMVWIVRFWMLAYSAKTDAFHAPPEAVTMPVMRYGKMPGKISVVQRCHRVNL